MNNISLLRLAVIRIDLMDSGAAEYLAENVAPTLGEITSPALHLWFPLKQQRHCEVMTLQNQGHCLTGLHDAKLSQVTQLHVTKSLPGADHGRVCRRR